MISTRSVDLALRTLLGHTYWQSLGGDVRSPGGRIRGIGIAKHLTEASSQNEHKRGHSLAGITAWAPPKLGWYTLRSSTRWAVGSPAAFIRGCALFAPRVVSVSAVVELTPPRYAKALSSAMKTVDPSQDLYVCRFHRRQHRQIWQLLDAASERKVRLGRQVGRDGWHWAMRRLGNGRFTYAPQG